MTSMLLRQRIKTNIKAKNQNKYRFSNAGSGGLAGSDGLVDTINDLLSKYGYLNKKKITYVVF